MRITPSSFCGVTTGFILGEKQHWAKRTLWEESTRVPLLISGPEIKPGKECKEPASLLDLYPTLLDLCNLPKNDRLEGISLVPQLNDPNAARKQPAISSSYFGNHSIRTRDWRLISYEDGAKELYDHRTDPDEFENLAKDPKHQALIKRLAKWLPKNAAPEFKEKSERVCVLAKNEKLDCPLLTIFFACSFWLEGKSKDTARPSVLLINVDDWNDWNTVLKGHSQAITPNIERFAKKGVTFSNAICASPSCVPSRPALFTGLPRRVRAIFQMTTVSVRGGFMPGRKPLRFRSYFLKTAGTASASPKTSTGGMPLNSILISHRSKLRKNSRRWA